jgi:hypothetical protein
LMAGVATGESTHAFRFGQALRRYERFALPRDGQS